MSKAELLAKMSPHGLVITGGTFGGSAAITAIDVAGALGMGGLSYPAYQFGMLKYAGDDQARAKVYRLVLIATAATAKAERWGVTDEQIESLAALAIHEHLNCPVCGKCNGCGQVAAKSCEQCLGTGRVNLSKRARAKLTGIERTEWNRRWDVRSRAVWAVMAGWEAELLAHLQKHFGKQAMETC
jgi:ribosomal protein L40E